MRKQLTHIGLLVLPALFALHPLYGAVTVATVPWVPASPLSPHTTYPVTSTTESNIVLGATVPSAEGTSDSLSVTWIFGDSSSNVTFVTTNPYDVSTTHQYPPSATNGTAWTATVTVTDETAGGSSSASYYVIQSQNNLAARVNVAIDWGLWYMHQTMWRNVSGGVNIGGWDQLTNNCNTVGGSVYDCSGNAVINAENVQAFEVSGHVASGPASDPYTDDVVRGLAEMFKYLAIESNVSQSYTYNPAKVNYRCSTATAGVVTNPQYTSTTTLGSLTYPYCPTGSTQVFYNAGATSCTSPPCAVTFDGNSNGQMIFSNDTQGETIYTTGPYIDALVASGTPNAVAPTGSGPVAPLPGVLGQTYKNIVQDMMDWYGACQYENDYDPGNPMAGYNGYVRGGGYSGSGGGWLYTCQEGDDNSTSQWGAIGLLGGYRGFGIPIPAVIQDFNNVWVTNSQANETGDYPTGPDPYGAGDDVGSFGYRGDIYNSNAEGPFAVTPSGGVQMALDGIGRTLSTAYSDASTSEDQRWNDYETYYADNFCNSTAGNNAVAAPRAYTYGMFSFTKSMLLHDPGGALTPIQYLRTKTAGVFSNPADPANSIDWYAALSSANGGADACDGVAQTLVSYQSPDGHWTGHDIYTGNSTGEQSPFETAWSIIMLNKTVFVSCVTNLTGRGSASGPFIALAWSAQTNANGYNVLRSSTNGGPYTSIGTTNLTNFRDTTAGLVAGHTYYYVVQPEQGSAEICQSNQAAVTIP
jgi:hypothetical protein